MVFWDSPSISAAKLLYFFDICKFWGDFLKFAPVWVSPKRKKKEKEKNQKNKKKKKVRPTSLPPLIKGGGHAYTRGDAAKAAWRSVGLIFLKRFLGCPSDFSGSFPGHGPVMVMCFHPPYHHGTIFRGKANQK